jgi:hypothetical protein
MSFQHDSRICVFGKFPQSTTGSARAGAGRTKRPASTNTGVIFIGVLQNSRGSPIRIYPVSANLAVEPFQFLS